MYLNMNKIDRLKIANKFIKIISKYGQRFFYNNKTKQTAYLKIKKNCVYYVSEYSGKEIYLHYRYWKFHHGGTLRYFIEELKEYIMGKCNYILIMSALKPFRKEICNDNLWKDIVKIWKKYEKNVKNYCKE